MVYEVEDHVVEDASICTTLGVKDGYIRRLYPTPVVKDGGRTKMLPKPVEKTRRAIASAASTARLVFEVGLSVASKGGRPVASNFGVFGLFLGRFWIISIVLGVFWQFLRVLRYSLVVVSNSQ